jgi:DNA-binding MarR family transcriptional regulator
MRKRKSSKYSLDNSLGYLTSNASRAVLKRINQELARRGFPITSDQFLVLVNLWDQGGQPQYALVEKLFKDKTQMARLVASLESLSLVTRQPGPRDGRERIVFLTDQGSRMMTRIAALVQEILDLAQRGIHKEDLATCKDVLRRFHANLL